MQWARLAFALFGLAAAAKEESSSSSSGESSSNAVVQLTSSNFDAFLKDNANSLVEFYAPWCGHCKKLAPEYEAAAEVLKADKIPLGKVDATEEKELAERFDIRGFPTLYFFRNGKHEEYDGGRTKDTIVQWVKSMTGPAVKDYEDKAEAVSAAKASEGVAYLLVAPSKDHESMKLWSKVADASRSKGVFMAVVDSKSKKSSVEVYGREGESYTSPKELLDEEAMLAFVKAESTPLFGAITPETYRAYAAKTENWFWFAGTPEDFEKSKEAVSKVARVHRDDINFVWLDAANEQFKRHAENMFGMTKFPSSAIVMGHDKYRYEGPFSEKQTGKFIKEVLDGKIEKFLLSEEIPEKNDEPVKVVVGKTFKDIVLQKDKDVFLEVYAPWCGHCKKLAPVWEELAAKTQESKNLIIAKMDGTANEAPVDGFDIRGFPTLFFIKANTTEPIPYSGDRSLSAFIKFIKDNAAHPVTVSEESKDDDDSKDEL
eukprot:Gregarina_sp_Pseudo_9__311@NODE_1200_length_1784_cov_455_554728_g1126_i0_p1_GENE_NODE_1200_length_1784_cov_455_554728_g1126_i0NODE_1200_length_1784_cov_455_554728_g1126_i0_p1_ORF_typecomplete_len486_score157_10Thioredoxin/PF00085_20/9_4e34Thioredoxin/PF00085_20/3_8e03Thioredoxin/PF00085_20/0_78Thioredoxin/PF00085_20/3e26Thioredoxin_6/PF13848_6/0_11Thioredoxin_6/PF13848_6/1e10Thioredoxin_6/PF13848_6/3_7e20Thioredoxin_6/PF13848_6/0_12Thioredoxin_6/PF13848_6/0_31Calsequestrin/PF01216_17/4_3e16Calse